MTNQSSGAAQPYRLAVLNSHPIQYFAPLYRRLASEPWLDLTVYYCSLQGAADYHDSEFKQTFRWDVPLLDGYRWKLVQNLRRSQAVGGAASLVNPGIVLELERHRFDALWVHGHHYLTNLLAIISARALRIPVLMRCETHLRLHRPAWKLALRQVLMSRLYGSFCAACLPIGSRNRQFYRRLGVPDERLFPVPYTVDNDFFAEEVRSARQNVEAVRSSLGLPPTGPVVLYVSKLTPRKRPLDLLLAFERVRRRSHEAALVFVGAGDEEAALRHCARDRHVPDVYFLNFRNQSELPALYAMADVFVLPSEDESWGLVVNEAMNAALPVVVTDEVGAGDDLVYPGENGFLYPSGDVDALAAHLQTLIANRDLRLDMGRRSREIIQTWSFEEDLRGIRAALSYVAPARAQELAT